MEGVSKRLNCSQAFTRAVGILFLLCLILPCTPIPSLAQSALPEPDGSAQQGEAPAAPSGAGTMSSVLPGGSTDPSSPSPTDPCNACPPLPAQPQAAPQEPATPSPSPPGMAGSDGGASQESTQSDTDPPNLPKARWPTRSELLQSQAAQLKAASREPPSDFSDRPAWARPMGDRNPEAQAGQPATTPPKNAIEQIASLLNQLHNEIANGIDPMEVAALVNLWGIRDMCWASGILIPP
ncbi:hypothetical protein [Methylacidimicrobium sp. B4]|uniref:hypothetical protein n=1 Tax=Methylacidimicrobium sp. B4 TaxID=2796139 RepID=UPI001A8E8496|nr:hypothetical protein [Methylacidimicrobium sp. B4]QSR85650.1 hypothetical protein MacB4_05380 [Methylacidimicrobium sp. B4]